MAVPNPWQNPNPAFDMPSFRKSQHFTDALKQAYKAPEYRIPQSNQLLASFGSNGYQPSSINAWKT
jgi:hypothetical protein